MSQLLKEVRKSDNLYDAWRKVRSNIVASGNEKFRHEIREIDLNPIRYIRRIQDKLQKNIFEFKPQRGSHKMGRPIVISPIENRIVQRAILNVLQSEKIKTKELLGKLPEIISTPTSIGGVPKGGVYKGIELVKAAIEAGATHYLKSDIKKFFVQIPKDVILSKIEYETKDKLFTVFFEKSLSTELENEEEIKELIHLFPIDNTGVPQGSSLSAIAGNILLNEFDTELNNNGITLIRYIDDFVILGKEEKNLRIVYKKSVKLLKKFGMDAYNPDTDKEKAGIGRIDKGFDFLGCHIIGKSISPSKKSKVKLIENITQTLKDGNSRIKKYHTDNKTRRAEETFIQTINQIDRKIRGWGDSFNFSNDTLPFIHLDKKLKSIIGDFIGSNLKVMSNLTHEQRFRSYGIALLQDTPPRKEPSF